MILYLECYCWLRSNIIRLSTWKTNVWLLQIHLTKIVIGFWDENPSFLFYRICFKFFFVRIIFAGNVIKIHFSSANTKTFPNYWVLNKMLSDKRKSGYDMCSSIDQFKTKWLLQIYIFAWLSVKTMRYCSDFVKFCLPFFAYFWLTPCTVVLNKWTFRSHHWDEFCVKTLVWLHTRCRINWRWNESYFQMKFVRIHWNADAPSKTSFGLMLIFCSQKLKREILAIQSKLHSKFGLFFWRSHY